MNMKINTLSDLDYPIPFEEQLRLEKEHKAELARLEAETDWFDIIGEAELIQVIKEKQIEFRQEIVEYKKLWERDLDRLDKHGLTGFDRYFYETLYGAIYTPKIESVANRAKHLLNLYRKHLQKRLPNYFDDDTSLTPTRIEMAKKVKISHLFEQDGHKLIKSGKNHKTLCPFHSERTPSCTIYLESNSFHCFGCSARGDSISYIQKSKNLKFQDAVGLLSGGLYE